MANGMSGFAALDPLCEVGEVEILGATAGLGGGREEGSVLGWGLGAGGVLTWGGYLSQTKCSSVTWAPTMLPFCSAEPGTRA